VKIDDPIKTTVEEIRKFLNMENVIGKTIETDEFLIIPVTKMGMGFGAGMGDGKMDNNSMGGAGSGGAGGVEPISVLVVHKGVSGPEGVKVMSLQEPDQISRVIREIKDSAVEMMGSGCMMMKGNCEDNKDDDKQKKLLLKEESTPNKETLKAEIPPTK
jgi:uncharacterized spore protein YtfJ